LPVTPPVSQLASVSFSALLHDACADLVFAILLYKSQTGCIKINKEPTACLMVLAVGHIGVKKQKWLANDVPCICCKIALGSDCCTGCSLDGRRSIPGTAFSLNSCKAEGSILVCDTVSLGWCFPTFRRKQCLNLTQLFKMTAVLDPQHRCTKTTHTSKRRIGEHRSSSTHYQPWH